MIGKYNSNNYEVEGKEIDLLKEKWDILVVLDACRYDIFKQNYKDYFDKGYLKKAVSPATGTAEWLRKTFGEDYLNNIIYISANPQFRQKMSNPDKKHFFKVIDVWKFGWVENLGTVPPLEVNKAFHKTYLRYPNKKFILHYLQPHEPYILLGGKNGKPTDGKKLFNFNQKSSDIFNNILKILIKQRWGVLWKSQKYFGIKPQKYIGQVWYEYGNKGLKSVYEYELKRVLKYVKMLVDTISANWLITADHGERLGENFKYGHGGSRDKEVIEVPWLKIKT